MLRVAVIPGDGIGPEVTAEAVRVMEAAVSGAGIDLETEWFDFGADRWLAEGIGIPDDEFPRLRDDFDAILLGAIGDPRVPGNEHAREILLGLRRRLDLYVNLRPCRFFQPELSPLRNPPPAGTLIDIVRENTEGAYADIGGHLRFGSSQEVAVQESVHTRDGVERILRYAFGRAAESGSGKVTLVDKANALPVEGGLWRRVFAEVGAEHAGIERATLFVDVAAMEMVRSPGAQGTIVTSNLFGDILSDLAGMVTGGLGLAPSANVHPGRHGLFEPVHGSAPDIAGTGVANPAGAILSVALLLRAHGESGLASAVEAAVGEVISGGVRTPDLGGAATTREVGSAVLEALRNR